MPSFPQYGLSPRYGSQFHLKNQNYLVQRNQENNDEENTDLSSKEYMIKQKIGTHFTTTKQAFVEIRKGTGSNSMPYLTLRDLSVFLNRNEPEENLSNLDVIINEFNLYQFLHQLFSIRGLLKESENGELVIPFEEFKQWISPHLERKEQFYFRHNSSSNPTFLSYSKQFEEGVKSPRKIFEKHPLTSSQSQKYIERAGHYLQSS